MASEIQTERTRGPRGPAIFAGVFVTLIVGGLIALFTFMIIDISNGDERAEKARVENQAQIENCWKLGGKAILDHTGWLKQCEVDAP